MSKLEKLRPLEDAEEQAAESFAAALSTCQDILSEMESFPDSVSRSVCIRELKRAITRLEGESEHLAKVAQAAWTATVNLGVDE